ncbi:MAG: Zn-ribbon domain-containing OB-fold protein [Ignavibacteriales bacterium]|nr:Zn-ribbon domain-containing OB-fold protein [Ignavibacteriales bacterium]
MISPRYHREVPQRYRLEAGKCKQCGHISFPPRLVCPKCKSKTFETVNLSREGKILTFTIIRVGPDKFSKETPYVVAIIELNDGVRLTAQVTDCDVDKVEIGNKAKLIFRKIQDEGKSGLHCYGYKAVLV